MKDKSTNEPPINAKLPGRFGKMTATDLDAQVERYDAPMVALGESRPLKPAERRRWKLAHAKMATPSAQRMTTIRVTVDRGLLRKADRAADTRGISRSKLISTILDTALR